MTSSVAMLGRSRYGWRVWSLAEPQLGPDISLMSPHQLELDSPLPPDSSPLPPPPQVATAGPRMTLSSGSSRVGQLENQNN